MLILMEVNLWKNVPNVEILVMTVLPFAEIAVMNFPNQKL